MSKLDKKEAQTDLASEKTRAEEVQDPSKAEREAILSLPQPSKEDITSRHVYLGPTTKKYTLLLDLDQTLVCAQELPVEDEDPLTIIYVRPYAVELLEKLDSLYDIVVFTAAEEAYAREAVGLLDTTGKVIHKLVSRKFCVPTLGGHLAKDLRIFADRCLSQMLLVDDNLWSFAFQLDNGIPVAPYYCQENDAVLLSLIQYLENLYTAQNIIQANREYFNLRVSLL